jgi:hypothetical protein
VRVEKKYTSLLKGDSKPVYQCLRLVSSGSVCVSSVYSPGPN